MENKTALITGCAGYLGSHLAKSLKKQGWKIVGLAHKRTTHNPYIDIIHYGDIRDTDVLNLIFEKFHIDVVYHLASRIEAGISFEQPTEFYSVNTGGTTNLLNSMYNHKVKNIVFSSSAAVYKAKKEPISENSEIVNNSPKNVYLCMNKYLNEFEKDKNSFILLDNGLKNVIKWYQFI